MNSVWIVKTNTNAKYINRRLRVIVGKNDKLVITKFLDDFDCHNVDFDMEETSEGTSSLQEIEDVSLYSQMVRLIERTEDA